MRNKTSSNSRYGCVWVW